MPAVAASQTYVQTPADSSALERAPVDVDPRADCCGKKIGILIVAYNAVNTLVKVLKRIRADAWKNVTEVVVFDDASQDFTYELALGFKATSQLDKLRVIRNPRNLGYGGNQKIGYRYFIDKGFDIVVLLHGDGQYAPEILSHLYHPIVVGEADAVFGSRMMKDYGGPLKGGMPLYKYVGNRILTAVENRALGLTLSEFHSGYRAYSLGALAQIDLSKMTDDFHFDTEIIIKLQHQGFRIQEVPIPTYYGDEICYVNGMKYAWNVTKAVMRYRRTVQSFEPAPEFSEYWVQYPVKESRYSSHYYLFQFVGSGKRTLDIGCGEGFVSARLADMNHKVTGIDALAEPKHLNRMEEYLQCDLMQGLGPVLPQLAGRSFDWILLMDVLEHLPFPERVLNDCHRLLAAGGQMLVSVPNIANVTVRLMLLFGRFNYTSRGIMDRTHLRFYTRRTARQLVNAAGYEIVREKTTVMPLEMVLGIRATNPVMRALNFLLAAVTRLFPNLLGYQIMLWLRRKAV